MVDHRLAVGVADRLGYLWCADCLRAAGILELNPEIDHVLWWDSAPFTQEPCDFCRRRLDRVEVPVPISERAAGVPPARAGRLPFLDSVFPARP